MTPPRVTQAVRACPDVLTLLRERAQSLPHHAAIEEAGGEVVSYADLLTRTERMAAALLQRFAAASKPLRIGIVLPNGLAMSQALLAVTVAGAALPFNPALTEAEFDACFGDMDLSALLTRPSFSPAAVRAAARLDVPVLDLDSLTPDHHVMELPVPAPDAIALVLLTSGSTGRAKRVPLSHLNVCTAARQVVRSMELEPSDRCLSMWELHHVGGLVDLLLAPLDSGGTVIATRGFDAGRFLELLSTSHPTWFQGVPATLGELALHARRGSIDPRGSTLRLLRSVAAALPPALMRELETLFAVPVLQTFGMTEASPLITSTSLPPAQRVPGSVGRSCGTEIRVLAPDGSSPAIGIEGEVAVRGPNVFAGYEGDPIANAEAFRDGWFRTGDLGRFDAAGNLYLTGRIKELVNRGGEKVNVREVEDALLLHPAVREAAVFPVPHATLGEDVAAAVVFQPGLAATAEELRTFLSARLAAFKLPYAIFQRDVLPRNAVGKIDRLAIARETTERQARPPEEPAVLSQREARVAAIWARELGLSSINPDDAFGSVGGDSLSAVRVIVALEMEFNEPLPDHALASHTTVRALAAAISDCNDQSPARASPAAAGLSWSERQQLLAVAATGDIAAVAPGSALKVVNRDGTRRPLFWFFNVPSREMNAMWRELPSRLPLYGGYSGAGIIDWKDHGRMTGVAEMYAAELLERFPAGSFTIGGNCQGARVGWMVAKRLREAGREVDALCFLEYSDPELTQFDGRLLMLFGKQSTNRRYLHIHWGEPGWESPFRRRPEVSWIEGIHGGFFRDETTPVLTRLILQFLDGEPLTRDTLESFNGRVVMMIHRIPLLFRLYCGWHWIKRGLRVWRLR